MSDSFNKIKISLVLNYIIFILAIFAAIIMFTGINFMNETMVLDISKFKMFYLYTVDSNLLVAIASLLLAGKERKLITGEIDEIPTKYYIFKMIGTSAVTLTFLVVVCYLARISQGGMMSMLQNANLFFHLIIPVLSIITFCFIERTNKIKFKYVFLTMLPIFIYGIFYLTNILLHVENGMVSKKYDFYWFVQGGLHQIYFVVPLLIFTSFMIGLGLWRLNRNVKKK